MDITLFKPSTTTGMQISENTIFNAIKNYIKVTNFPKKLLLKKLDMLIDKKKLQVTKYAKMLVLAKKIHTEMTDQINSLQRRNSKDIQELIDFLS